MGALTSKPYAFSSRPWELEGAPFFDYFDPLLPSVRLDFRGLRIMRVLPLLGDWIGDKIRFCHDALGVQRLLFPGVKPFSLGQDWLTVLGHLQTFFRTILLSQSPTLVFFGPHLDLHFLGLLRPLWDLLSPGLRAVVSFFPPAPALPDSHWRSDFLSPQPLSLDSSDLILLLGANPRISSPLLSSSLCRRVASGVPAYAFGLSQHQGYPALFLGPVSQFFSLLEGFHPLSLSLLGSRAPLALLGDEFFRLPSAAGLLDRLRRRLPHLRSLPLPSSVGALAVLELGFPLSSPRPPAITRPRTALALASFHWYLRRPTPDSLFLGHHYVPFQNSLPTFLLPVSAPLEKAGQFLDLFGQAKEFHSPIAPPPTVRSDSALVQALATLSGLPLQEFPLPRPFSLFLRPPFLISHPTRPQPPLISRSSYFGSDPLSLYSPIASLRLRALGRFFNWVHVQVSKAYNLYYGK